MNLTLLSETNVSSLAAKLGWFFNTISVVASSIEPLPLRSMNTIQPFCQFEFPAQAPALVAGQTVTVRPCLSASERANCRSNSSPFTSADTRLEVVMYRYEGIPTAMMMAITATVTINSTSVRPCCGFLLAAQSARAAEGLPYGPTNGWGAPISGCAL